MAEFYNPYQFIEFTGKVNEHDVSSTEFEQIKLGNNHIRHDLWSAQEGIHHGRILCQLKLLSPTMTGNQQQEKDPIKTTISQYQYKKQYAVQANSLRGVVSNILETISQSSLRVLSDKKYRMSQGRYKVKDDFDSTYAFFAESSSMSNHKNYTNALPWGNGRDSLTPAENMLGAVQAQDQNYEQQQQGSLNLASRVHFSDALGNDIKITSKEFNLKILASPKPNDKKATPSACLYFKPRYGSGYIATENLLAEKHEANGHKFYMPHKFPVDKKKWETKGNEHNKQKVKGKPLESGQTLYFHVDFNNLTTAELILLQTALQPDKNYQYCLGLGKPLGLGQVKIEIIGTFFIERSQRYSVQEEENERYYAVNKDLPNIENTGFLSSRYKEEMKVFNQVEKSITLATETNLIDQETLELVQRLGNINNQRDIPVCYPYSDSQKPYNEDNGYDWSVKNKRWKQYLATLNSVSDEIPTLINNGAKPTKQITHNIEIGLVSRDDEICFEEMKEVIKNHLKIDHIKYQKFASSDQHKKIRLCVVKEDIKTVCDCMNSINISGNNRLMCRELK